MNSLLQSQKNKRTYFQELWEYEIKAFHLKFQYYSEVLTYFFGVKLSSKIMWFQKKITWEENNYMLNFPIFLCFTLWSKEPVQVSLHNRPLHKLFHLSSFGKIEEEDCDILIMPQKKVKRFCLYLYFVILFWFLSVLIYFLICWNFLNRK